MAKFLATYIGEETHLACWPQPLAAGTMEDAIVEVTNEVFGASTQGANDATGGRSRERIERGARLFDRVLVFEVAKADGINVQAMALQWLSALDLSEGVAEKAKEAAERAEYERLRLKYGVDAPVLGGAE